MYRIDTFTLAEVLLSSANTFDNNKKLSKYKHNETENFFKRIIFDFRNDYTFLMVDNENLAYLTNGDYETYNGTFNMTNILSEKLKEILNGDIDNLEFVKVDDLTKTVYVITKGFIDKMYYNSDEYFVGNLVLDYYNNWYYGKCGPNRAAIAHHHKMFKTFANKEMAFFKQNYIPIAIAPYYMSPIRKTIENCFEVSVLRDFVIRDVAYNIYAKRVEGSESWWIPQLVAKDYLGENNLYNVTSYKVLEKMLRTHGYLNEPRIEEEEPLNSDILNNIDIKSLTDEFILDSKNNQRNEYRSTSPQISTAINIVDRRKIANKTKIETTETKIAGDITSLDLDY